MAFITRTYSFEKEDSDMIVYLQMLETSEEKNRFEELVHTYKNLMFYVANQILNNDYDAEDAVQQAFFAILKNFEKVSEIKCPQTRSFVVTVVERKAIDLYRAKNRSAVIFMVQRHTQQIEKILSVLTLCLIPVHLIGSWINAINSIDKGYGHTYPLETYVLIPPLYEQDEC